MLIVKTERLQQRRGLLGASDLAEQSLNLAVEQRMIRAEFVFMLGGEINDEEVEAEQSVELQAGRLQNRGQRDLRAATLAMSQAEKLLTGANTAAALIAAADAARPLLGAPRDGDAQPARRRPSSHRQPRRGDRVEADAGGRARKPQGGAARRCPARNRGAVAVGVRSRFSRFGDICHGNAKIEI